MPQLSKWESVKIFMWWTQLCMFFLPIFKLLSALGLYHEGTLAMFEQLRALKFYLS